jgi:hypothetical protein
LGHHCCLEGKDVAARHDTAIPALALFSTVLLLSRYWTNPLSAIHTTLKRMTEELGSLSMAKPFEQISDGNAVRPERGVA